MAKRKQPDADPTALQINFALRFIDPAMYLALQRYAKANYRSTNNQILMWIERGLREAKAYPPDELKVYPTEDS